MSEYRLYRVRLQTEVLVAAPNADEAASFAEGEPECFDGEVIAVAQEAKRKSTADEEMGAHPWRSDDDIDDLRVDQWLDLMEERERQAFAQAEFMKRQLKLPKVE